MAHSILSQLKQKKSQVEAAELNITDRVYQAMMEDARDEIREKAMMEARLAVQGELSQAKTSMASAQAETTMKDAELTKERANLSAIKEKLNAAAADNKRLKTQIEALTKTVKLEQGTSKGMDKEHKQKMSEMEKSIRELNGRIHDFEVENSHLKGQLAAPKPKLVAKKRSIPEFQIDNVTYGGPEGRIMSVRVKPVEK
jgi:chromosome segregation ATPase